MTNAPKILVVLVALSAATACKSSASKAPTPESRSEAVAESETKQEASAPTESKTCCKVHDAELGRDFHTWIASPAACADTEGTLAEAAECAEEMKGTVDPAQVRICCAAKDDSGNETFTVEKVSVDCEEKGGHAVEMGRCDYAR